jgi:hypothetical protein
MKSRETLKFVWLFMLGVMSLTSLAIDWTGAVVNGVWDTSDANWATTPIGEQVWDSANGPGNDAVFTNLAALSVNVSITNDVYAKSLSVADHTYMGGAGALHITDVITVPEGKVLSLDLSLKGGVILKAGAGILEIKDSSDLANIVVTAGTVRPLPLFPRKGLQYHLDASCAASITYQSANNVQTWSSMESNVSFARNGAVNGYPFFKSTGFNGKGSVSFEKVSTTSMMTQPQTIDHFSVFSAVKLSSTYAASSGVLLGVGTTIGLFCAIKDSGGGGAWSWSQQIGDKDFSVSSTGTAGSNGRFFIDNLLKRDTTNAIPSGNTTPIYTDNAPHVITAIAPSKRTWAGSKMGSGNGANNPFNAEVGETLVYNRNVSLDVAERTLTEKYLMNKWLGSNFVTGASSIILSNQTLSLSADATFDLDERSIVLTNLTGEGTLKSSGWGEFSKVTLDLPVAQTNTFNGSIAGRVDFVKTGDGTFLLDTDSTGSWSGSTLIAGGCVAFGKGLSFTKTQPASINYTLDAMDTDSLTLTNNSRLTVWKTQENPLTTFSSTIHPDNVAPIYLPEAFNNRGGVEFGNNSSLARLDSNSMMNPMGTLALVLKVDVANPERSRVFGNGNAGDGLRIGTSESGYAFHPTGENSSGIDFYMGANGNLALNGDSAARMLTAGQTTVLFSRRGDTCSSLAVAKTNSIGQTGLVRANPFFTGVIGEARAYSTRLSSDEQKTVEYELMKKWGVPIPESYYSGTGAGYLPTATALIITNNATLDLNGLTQTVGSLNCAGQVLDGALLVTGSVRISGPSQLPGSVLDGVSKTVVMEKANTITLEGSANLATVNINIVDMATIQSGQWHTLISCPGGTLTYPAIPKSIIDFGTMPESEQALWFVKATATVFSLCKGGGTMITFQ